MKAVNVMSRKAGEGVQQQGKSRQLRSKGKDGKAKKSEAKKKVAKVAKKPEESKASVGAGITLARQYLREVVYEMRKVVWPSRKETVASTAVVLAIVIICGVFLGVVDFILNRFVRLLIG